VVLAKLGDAVRKSLPANESTKVTDPLVFVNSSLNTSFEVNSPSLVEPEVFPASAALCMFVSATGSFKEKTWPSRLEGDIFGMSSKIMLECNVLQGC
jgi:hypothetical protein